MPPIDVPRPGPRPWERLLWTLDRAVAWGGRRLFAVALVLLLLTGALLAVNVGAFALLGTADLRAVHAASGLVLAFLTLARGVAGLYRTWRTIHESELGPWPVLRDLGRRFSSVEGLLGLWFWLVLVLLLVSGLGRFLLLRYGQVVPPAAQPALWWAMHHAMVPHLYAALALLALVRGKAWYRRTVAYLYSP